MYFKEWFNDMELYRQSELNNEKIFREDLKNYLSKYQMKLYMLTMFIKLKVREEIYFQILMEMKIL